MLSPFRDVPTATLREASRSPRGRPVKVEAWLALHGDGHATLCDVDPDGGRSDCPPDAALLRGVTVRGERQVVGAKDTLIVRRTVDGFESPIVAGAWSPWSSAPRAAARRPFVPSRTVVSGVSAALGGRGGVGGEVTIEGRRGRLDPHQGARGPLTYLVGYDIGLAVHGRLLADPIDGRTTWSIGLDPVLETTDLDRRWTMPSPLGLLLPEVGLLWRGSLATPYVGWSLPIGWTLVSPRDRKHPFVVEDVLGIRAALLAWVPWSPSVADVFVGASLGLSFSPR